MPMEVPYKFSKVFDERVSSLLADGYCKRVDTRLPSIWYVRLKHMTNGNEIRLYGYPSRMNIRQVTNNIETHNETVDV